ncbi:MAG: M14 family zinc carboxypeptidase [Bryobacteraceae bacterium]
MRKLAPGLAKLLVAWLAATLAATLVHAQSTPAIPSPEQYFGFKMGADKKLARYDKIADYLKLVAARSGRVRVETAGTTTQGNPFIIVEVASTGTIRNLDRYKALERKLYFQGGAPSDAERERIFRDGKAVVFISNNIHSTEIGASQMAVELVYRLATENSRDVQKILDNVILVMEPSANPDGQMMVTDWYNKYLGTPFEAAPMPYLYQTYAGHDDNRDLFMLSQKESQITARLLWHDWFPSIWLDEHQQGNLGPRIFTMPASYPINPNVHPLIYRLDTLFGQAQAAALEAGGKDGIIHNTTYTNFWEGAMAWSGWWHNEVGLLTEVASVRIASPVIQRYAQPGKSPVKSPVDLSIEDGDTPAASIPGGLLPPPPDTLSRSDYPRPWLGGEWHLRDIVDYEMVATFGLLDAAADRREALLRDIYEVNLSTIGLGQKGQIGFGDAGRSYAILIPREDQHDSNEVSGLIAKLRLGGVEVYRAAKGFMQDGDDYSAGTYVIPFNQVFARYAKDLMERQTYPEIRRAPNTPAEPPYDVSAWSLGLQFGVKTVFAKTPLPVDLALDPVNRDPGLVLSAEKNGNSWNFAYTGAESAVVVNRLLKAGAKLSFSKTRGHVESAMVQAAAQPSDWSRATHGFEVAVQNSATEARAIGPTLRVPRIGLYQPWTADIDEGWTRWVLERYEFPYTTLHNHEIQAGNLRARFDAIILPNQPEQEIVDGNISAMEPPEYRGGLDEAGLAALKDFVHHGGTLIALGEASDLLLDQMPLPVKDIKRTLSRDQHFAPGAIVNLQIDTNHPVGFGMPAETFGFYINSPFFEITNGFSSYKTSVVARYPNMDVRASGWLRGEPYMLGRAAVVAIEMNPGKVVLFGIRPQHRAQTHATLPLLFNALYWSAEGDLAASQ